MVNGYWGMSTDGVRTHLELPCLLLGWNILHIDMLFTAVQTNIQISYRFG